MSVRDAINHALQDNPSELKNSIYSALDAKVADALELKKISTASEYFNMPEEEYEEEDASVATDEATRSAKELGYDDKTANKTKFGPGTRKHGGADWQSRPGSGAEDAADKKNPDRESHQKWRRARGLGNVSGGHGNPKATKKAKDIERNLRGLVR